MLALLVAPAGYLAVQELTLDIDIRVSLVSPLLNSVLSELNIHLGAYLISTLFGPPTGDLIGGASF